MAIVLMGKRWAVFFEAVEYCIWERRWTIVLTKEVQTCKPVDGLADRPLVSIVSNKESRITAPYEVEQSTCMMCNVSDQYTVKKC